MHKRLFTPGPLTTSATVRQAMMVDYGSRDAEFVDMVCHIRQELLRLAQVDQGNGYEAALMAWGIRVPMAWSRSFPAPYPPGPAYWC